MGQKYIRIWFQRYTVNTDVSIQTQHVTSHVNKNILLTIQAGNNIHYGATHPLQENTKIISVSSDFHVLSLMPIQKNITAMSKATFVIRRFCRMPQNVTHLRLELSEKGQTAAVSFSFPSHDPHRNDVSVRSWLRSCVHGFFFFLHLET